MACPPQPRSACSLVRCALVVLLASCAVTAQASAGAGDFAVAAYLPEWRYEGANWQTIARGTSHLILFSLEVSPAGDILHRDSRLPRPAILREAAAAAGDHATALMVCFGGNGRSAGFSAMAASEGARHRFATGVKALLTELEAIDTRVVWGVDINWEYPGWVPRYACVHVRLWPGDGDKSCRVVVAVHRRYVMGQGYMHPSAVRKDYEGLAAMLKQLRATLGDATPLTLAYVCPRICDGHITGMPNPSVFVGLARYYPDRTQEPLLARGGAGATVDLMHMMSYDQGGAHHSSREWGNAMVDQAASLLPRSKVTAGLPFYGRFSTTGDWQSYDDIVQRHWPLDPDADSVVTADNVGNPARLGFNGVATITSRTAHAIASGLGGVMIWEVGQDCRTQPVTHGDTTHVRTCPGDGDDASLLAAIASAMHQAGVQLPAFTRVAAAASATRSEL